VDSNHQPRCLHGHSALCGASCRHLGSDDLVILEELSAVRKRPIVPMPTTAPPAAALRPPPSVSRSMHRGRHRRHGPRNPSLNDAWLAGRGADARSVFGCCGPHRAGAPTGDPEAAATRPEAHGAAPIRTGPAPNLRVSSHRSASARRTREGAFLRAVASRCERSCGSCVSRPLGSMPGAGDSLRVRSRISALVPAQGRHD